MNLAKLDLNAAHRRKPTCSLARWQNGIFSQPGYRPAGMWNHGLCKPDAYVVVDPLRNAIGNVGIGPVDHYFVRWSRRGGTTMPAQHCYYVSFREEARTLAVCSDVRDGAAVGTSMVCQTISVPAAQDMPAPVLFFRYRVLTYDVIWGPNTHKYYDSFDVGIASPGSIEPTYVFTDGNRSIEGKLLDLGWREGSIDLRPYAGQTVRVCLSNITREDRLEHPGLL